MKVWIKDAESLAQYCERTLRKKSYNIHTLQRALKELQKIVTYYIEHNEGVEVEIWEDD